MKAPSDKQKMNMNVSINKTLFLVALFFSSTCTAMQNNNAVCQAQGFINFFNNVTSWINTATEDSSKFSTNLPDSLIDMGDLFSQNCVFVYESIHRFAKNLDELKIFFLKLKKRITTLNIKFNENNFFSVAERNEIILPFEYQLNLAQNKHKRSQAVFLLRFDEHKKIFECRITDGSIARYADE